MITQFYSFILTFFFGKDSRNCIICLEGGLTRKLPCNICKKKYIHQRCLDHYKEHNTNNRKCFLCNTGNLTFERNYNCICIKLPRIKITLPEGNIIDNVCTGFLNFVIFSFYFMLGIMTSSFIFLFLSVDESDDFFFPIFFIIGSLIGIFYWYLHKKKICQCFNDR